MMLVATILKSKVRLYYKKFKQLLSRDTYVFSTEGGDLLSSIGIELITAKIMACVSNKTSDPGTSGID